MFIPTMVDQRVPEQQGGEVLLFPVLPSHQPTTIHAHHQTPPPVFFYMGGGSGVCAVQKLDLYNVYSQCVGGEGCWVLCIAA